MPVFLVILFVGFGAKTEAMHSVNAQCIAKADKGAVCQQVANSKFVKSTNPTPLGMED